MDKTETCGLRQEAVSFQHSAKALIFFLKEKISRRRFITILQNIFCLRRYVERQHGPDHEFKIFGAIPSEIFVIAAKIGENFSCCQNDVGIRRDKSTVSLNIVYDCSGKEFYKLSIIVFLSRSIPDVKTVFLSRMVSRERKKYWNTLRCCNKLFDVFKKSRFGKKVRICQKNNIIFGGQKAFIF